MHISQSKSISVLKIHLEYAIVQIKFRSHFLYTYELKTIWPSRLDTKQSDDEAPVMLELLGMQSTPSLSLLTGPMWPRVVVPDRAQSMSQIELNCDNTKLNCLKLPVFHLTECKQKTLYCRSHDKLNCLK